MKRIIILMSLLSAFWASASAQDTLSVFVAPALDTALAVRGLYSDMPANVRLVQDPAVADAFRSVVETNATQDNFTGFRIKVYQSSDQSARFESESIKSRLESMFPSIPSYRSYSNPYFKVTFGDFRTRVEAEKMLRTVRESYPSATIVKEKMKYPLLYVSD